MRKIVKNLKYLSFSDIFAPFIFILTFLPSLIFRFYNAIMKRKIWLVTENGYTARDNGYHFYKHIRTNHPDIRCYYVIDKKSNDYSKVRIYGNTIQFKSFKHWIYYLSAEYNISSQKLGNPNQIFFYFIHVVLGLYNNRVFLQHGVTKDMCDWLLYKNTKFKYFVCGAKREYEYVKENYGYPKGSVVYTGLSRFDNLHDVTINKNQILVMPTWRSWLGRKTNFLEKNQDFKKTEYYKNWNKFLNDEKLNNFLETNNIILLFYPHIEMQKYLSYFKTNCSNIKIISTSVDIQQVLKESALMITDYSSVYMDFGYLKKEVLYYQFDLDEYRSRQYQQGYFSYECDGFGPVIKDKNELVDYIIKLSYNDFETEKIYLKRMNNFFELRDKNNSERIYKILMKDKKGVNK